MHYAQAAQFISLLHRQDQAIDPYWDVPFIVLFAVILRHLLNLSIDCL